VKVKEGEAPKCASLVPKLKTILEGYVTGTAIVDFMPNEVASDDESKSKIEDSQLDDKKSEISQVMKDDKPVNEKVYESGIFDGKGDLDTADPDNRLVIGTKKGQLYADDMAGLMKKDDASVQVEESIVGMSSFMSQFADNSDDNDEDEDPAKKNRRKKKRKADNPEHEEEEADAKRKADPVAVYNDMLYADVFNAVVNPKLNPVSLRNGNKDPRLYSELNVRVGNKEIGHKIPNKFLYEDLK